MDNDDLIIWTLIIVFTLLLPCYLLPSYIQGEWASVNIYEWKPSALRALQIYLLGWLIWVIQK